MAQTLFNMATIDKNVAAAIFWLKARAGWREKHDVQVKVGRPPLSELTDTNSCGSFSWIMRLTAPSMQATPQMTSRRCWNTNPISSRSRTDQSRF
jgi:hypothetical protein